jgi:hypothetical protein
VFEVLQAQGEGNIDELVQDVGNDLPVDFHPVARLSLLAHVIKLEQEERAHQLNKSWRPV